MLLGNLYGVNVFRCEQEEQDGIEHTEDPLRGALQYQ
jgi:hypothetical protein